MSKVQTLTVENLSVNDTDHGPGLKRHSIRPSDGDGTSTTLTTTNPSIRRMSRMDPRGPNLSNRRMSMASRTSVTGSSLAKHIGLFPVKLQNTYRTEPHQNEVFRPGRVRDVIKEVLEECLDGEKYNATQCRNLSQMLTDLIKNRVKDMGFPRYKLIVSVTLGQDCSQGVQVVSRCLWNKDTDNYAEAHYSKDGLYAVATVYALYFE